MAVNGFCHLLENLSSRKFDFVSLGFFGEETELAVDFTKDYGNLVDVLKNKCNLRTKTDYSNAFIFALNHCSSVWASNSRCHCVVVTDYDTADDVSNEFSSAEQRETLNLLLKNSNVEFHVCFLGEKPPNTSQKRQSLFDEVFAANSAGGNAFYFNTFPIKSFDAKTLNVVMDNLYETYLSPLKTKLTCGSLVSDVFIYPKDILSESSGKYVDVCSENVEIFGFLKPQQLENPPIASKHLLLARGGGVDAVQKNGSKQQSVDDEKQANFCVLLHGSLKIEDAVALCRLSPDRFGFICSFADGKRSNLILNCFKSGEESILWLGSIGHLMFKTCSGQTTKCSNSLQFKTKPSYATSNSAWVQTYGFQSDLQKVARYAKKLPDKETLFYQELNRVLNHAMSLGCVDLIGNFIEKELSNVAYNSPQFVHLNHVLNVVRGMSLKYGEPVLPTYK